MPEIPNITIHQAAEMLGVCWKTVNKWIHDGKLRAVKVGGRYRTTEEWIKESVTPLPCLRPVKENRSNRDNEETLRFLQARFGVKVPHPKMRRRRATEDY